MSVIHKYALRLGLISEWTIMMPAGARFLSAQEQDGLICMWFQHDGAPAEWRHFKIVGTGHPFVSAGVTFLATVQIPPFVWHVFEMQETRHD